MAVLSQLFGLARSLILYRARPWKRRRLRAFYGQFVGPGDLAYDIGAHVGDRLGAFVALGARVVAVEPQPLFLAVLRRLYGRLPAVTLIDTAVGAAPGEAELLISDATPTVSTLNRAWAERQSTARGFRHVRWNTRATVAVTTLDALIAAHGEPAFCKIDVEGSELAVLQGLSQPLAALSFEYTPAAPMDAVACVARLCTLGAYRFNASIGESLRFVFPAWQDAAAITTWLRARTADERSGDIYVGWQSRPSLRPRGPTCRRRRRSM